MIIVNHLITRLCDNFGQTMSDFGGDEKRVTLVRGTYHIHRGMSPTTSNRMEVIICCQHQVCRRVRSRFKRSTSCCCFWPQTTTECSLSHIVIKVSANTSMLSLPTPFLLPPLPIPMNAVLDFKPLSVP